jgi:hypothetical protein
MVRNMLGKFPCGSRSPISAARVKNLVLWRGGGHPRLTYPFHGDPACALFLSLSHTMLYMYVCLLSKADAVCGSPLDHSPLLSAVLFLQATLKPRMRSGCTLWVLHAHLSLECSDLSPHCCIFTKLSNPRRVLCMCASGKLKNKSVRLSLWTRGVSRAHTGKRHTRKAN